LHKTGVVLSRWRHGGMKRRWDKRTGGVVQKSPKLHMISAIFPKPGQHFTVIASCLAIYDILLHQVAYLCSRCAVRAGRGTRGRHVPPPSGETSAGLHAPRQTVLADMNHGTMSTTCLPTRYCGSRWLYVSQKDARAFCKDTFRLLRGKTQSRRTNSSSMVGGQRISGAALIFAMHLSMIPHSTT